MKDFIPTISDLCAAFGVVGGLISSALGGVDAALQLLLICMVIDYVTGVILACVFHASAKTDSGGYSSAIGFRGIARKCMILLMILIASRLDMVLGVNAIRDAVCFAYIANEIASIIENAGLMGIPIPGVIENAVDLLKGRGENVEL